MQRATKKIQQQKQKRKTLKARVTQAKRKALEKLQQLSAQISAHQATEQKMQSDMVMKDQQMRQMQVTSEQQQQNLKVAQQQVKVEQQRTQMEHQAFLNAAEKSKKR